MKLLNRDEFLKLPEGSLYAENSYGDDLEYQLSDFRVKGKIGEIPTDFYYVSLINPAFRYYDNSIVGSDSFAVFTAKELSEMTKLIQVGLRLAINGEKNTNAPT